MKQEFVTLPREVVERAIEALRGSETPTYRAQYDIEIDALVDLSAALEQPQAEQPAMTPIAQRKLDDLVASGYTISGYSVYHEQKHQHGFVTGAGFVGWWRPEGMEYQQPRGEQTKIGSHRDAQEVPFEDWWEKHGQYLKAGGGQYEKTFAWHAWCEAAKKAQPQGEQEPVAWIRGSGLEMLKLENGGHATVYASDGMSNHSQPLYTHPHPKRAPLTDEQIINIADDYEIQWVHGGQTYDQFDSIAFARAIESAHNIK